ncbi:hypothetical protein BST81_08920 [Leptolyngbya sp. 'hensonii']|nr:hypothetical protein BST81_08920 [Leptolyngbya sp. 'hensonii']
MGRAQGKKLPPRSRRQVKGRMTQRIVQLYQIQMHSFANPWANKNETSVSDQFLGIWPFRKNGRRPWRRLLMQ